ncbi:MAG: divergent polysaccharide deacetylase family protein [Spirochaetia bacterium]
MEIKTSSTKSTSDDTPSQKNNEAKSARSGLQPRSGRSKRRGGPQHRRVQLAYLLLSIIAGSLLLLLILMPGGEEVGTDISGKPRAQDPGPPPPEQAPKPEPKATDPAEQEYSKPDETQEERVVHPLSDIEAAPPGAGTLYLVIDDVGYNLQQLQTYLQLPIPMTFALLPGLEYSRPAQEIIAKHGAEMILHQPIEPVGDQDPGPGALYVGMQPEELRRVVHRNLEQLPQVVGVNNHMGSRGTADPQLMEALFSVLKGRDLFFLDSRTTAETVAARVARKTGLPFSERNVFLDNIEDQLEIEKALAAALEISRAQGYAVMIGHVWSRELASTLALWYAEIEEQGYQFARLSSFFAEEHVHAGNGN